MTIRVLGRNEARLARFLDGQEPLATAPAIIAAGTGLVRQGTVMMQDVAGKLRPADGHSRLVTGILLGNADASAGTVPATVVTRIPVVAGEGIILPANTTEGSTLVPGLTESQVVTLLLWLRCGITVRRRETAIPMHREIADWKSHRSKSWWR